MRTFGLVLAVLGLALATLPAHAQETGETSFTLVAKSQGGSFVWTDESGSRVNPTLTVPASTEITITAKQGSDDGIPHNIKVGNNPTSGNFDELDESVEYKFTSPASGTLDYVCAIHPTTMKGTVSVAGSGGETGGNESPGVALLGTLLAFVGVALFVARRR